MADIPSRTPRLSIDSPDDDEGTLETAPSSPSSRRPLSIVEEVPALSSDGGDEDHTATPDALKETSKNPILPPSTAPLLEGAPDMRPPSALATATLSDAASTRSMPTTPTTAGVDQPVAPVSPSPVRPRPSTAEESASARDIRRSRHRSTLDPGRPANNRFSGFITNLVHRRGSQLVGSGSSSSARGTPRDASPTPRSRRKRSPSPPPQPPPRPPTPPPMLPAPTLGDLGLSLSSITTKLSPSHFSSPPTSGAFLAPNYLLLCHAQGLDVLPLGYPPVPQPYALVRRVPFKSVVVMEHRGVLVAIAGRRDGVRVYALEEIKKAVEWRIDVETRRERERARREEARKRNVRELIEGPPALSLPGPRTPKTPTVPRQPSQPDMTPRKSKAPSPSRQSSRPSLATPVGPPPAYTGAPSPAPSSRSRPEGSPTAIPIMQHRRQRGTSISEVLAGLPTEDIPPMPQLPRDDIKGDWIERSMALDPEEAIDVVAAGASGGQALDERTSGTPSTAATIPSVPVESAPMFPLARTPTATTIQRSTRPADLDLTNALPDGAQPIPDPQPSPVPTLRTLRQSLMRSPRPARASLPGMRPLGQEISSQQFEPPETPDADDEDDEEDVQSPAREQVSFAQMLLESRLPELPPPGSRRPQQPILLAGGADEVPSSPRASETNSTRSRQSVPETTTPRARRRRWSVLGGIFPPVETQPMPAASSSTEGSLRVDTSRPVRGPPPLSAPPPSGPPGGEAAPPMPPPMARAQTSRGSRTAPSNIRARASASVEALVSDPAAVSSDVPQTPRGSRLSRMLSSAFHPRKSDDRAQSAMPRHSDVLSNVPGHPTPAPKLEYVKLPGTKGALLIKSVETAKKSFLAILCGENGEKVELFAGTYRTALGLSRTFILPDSPRSLELQLQGDDLVEVFLVFSQNVFGLEPATVRVREVRIGRAERRAARRRARGARGEDASEAAAPEDDTNVNVTVSVATAATGEGALAAPANEDGGGAPLEPGVQVSTHTISASAAADDQAANGGADTPTGAPTPTRAGSPSEDAAAAAVAAAAASLGPFTTFQQLLFAPSFPLASIANEYIIPPTYASFLQYRAEHEPEASGNGGTDLAAVQFTPPGLPLPPPLPPSKWFYRDPKGVVHGPWKASLMQAWYKDRLLPPDLPVRREEDEEYVLLKDLRAQSVDPTHPFRAASPPLAATSALLSADEAKPLLLPISLLSQPRHFGPPALFYSSRGGHSTTIVDARGRSVIKGRFLWTSDDDAKESLAKLGDVRHLEAFDVKDRAVLVALRQGGLEAVDLGDALLRPGDESRPVLPHFAPVDTQVARRHGFVWRIGTPTGFLHGAPAAVALHRPSGSGAAKTPTRKASLKSPGRSEFTLGDGGDARAERASSGDEVFFIGRRDEEVYFCERMTSSFRILRLSLES